MLELVDKSPIPVIKHREYMKNAHKIDAEILADKIKRYNCYLYNKLNLNLYNTKKLRFNSKTGLIENKYKMVMVEAFASNDYYIIKVAGTIYYIKRNGL